MKYCFIAFMLMANLMFAQSKDSTHYKKNILHGTWNNFYTEATDKNSPLFNKMSSYSSQVITAFIEYERVFIPGFSMRIGLNPWVKTGLRQYDSTHKMITSRQTLDIPLMLLIGTNMKRPIYLNLGFGINYSIPLLEASELDNGKKLATPSNLKPVLGYTGEFSLNFKTGEKFIGIFRVGVRFVYDFPSSSNPSYNLVSNFIGYGIVF